MGRRHAKNIYQPQMLLNFKINEHLTKKSIPVHCNYANLKHLQQSLQEALKMHNSAKFRSARNSSI